MVESAKVDPTDGLYDSAHEDPTALVAMLTAYLDESAAPQDGYYIVGGFIGNEVAWRKTARVWRRSLGEQNFLRMRTLRLAANAERHKNLLDQMGAISGHCGLTPVIGFVRVSDYADLVQGTVAEVVMSGYSLSLWPLVVFILDSIVRSQRVKLVFAQQAEHAVMREIILSEISRMPQYRTFGGNPMLAEWSSVPMSTLLEPADYFTYAALQHNIDKHSVKAKVTSPILRNHRKIIGMHLGRDAARTLYTQVHSTLGGMTPLGMTENVAC